MNVGCRAQIEETETVTASWRDVDFGKKVSNGLIELTGRKLARRVGNLQLSGIGHNVRHPDKHEGF